MLCIIASNRPAGTVPNSLHPHRLSSPWASWHSLSSSIGSDARLVGSVGLGPGRRPVVTPARRFIFAAPACGARRVSPPACVGLGVRGLAVSATSTASRVLAIRDRGSSLNGVPLYVRGRRPHGREGAALVSLAVTAGWRCRSQRVALMVGPGAGRTLRPAGARSCVVWHRRWSSPRSSTRVVTRGRAPFYGCLSAASPRLSTSVRLARVLNSPQWFSIPGEISRSRPVSRRMSVDAPGTLVGLGPPVPAIVAAGLPAIYAS